MPSKVDPDALGAQYRDAKNAVVVHRHREVEADLARMGWLRKHRGIPAQKLYDPSTGDPTHPELIALEAALAKASADVAWCKCLVLACGEAYKGEPLATVLARNEAHRPHLARTRAQAEES